MLQEQVKLILQNTDVEDDALKEAEENRALREAHEAEFRRIVNDGARLAAVNKSSTILRLTKFDDEVIAAVKQVKPTLLRIASYAGASTIDDKEKSRLLGDAVKELLIEADTLIKGSKKPKNKQHKTVFSFWQKLEALPDKIILVMHANYAEAAHDEVDGVKNDMLPVFAALADVHSSIGNYMANKGHHQFRKVDVQYKILIPEWKSFTTALLSFTLFGMSTSLKKYHEQHKHDIVDSVVVIDSKAENNSRTQVSNGGNTYNCYVTIDDEGQHYYAIGRDDEKFTFEKDPVHPDITNIKSKYHITESNHLTTPGANGDIYTPLHNFITVRDVENSEKKLVIKSGARSLEHDVSNDGNKLKLTHIEKDHQDYVLATTAAQLLTFFTGLVGLAFAVRDKKTITYNKKKPETSFDHLDRELARRSDGLSNHLNGRA